MKPLYTLLLSLPLLTSACSSGRENNSNEPKITTLGEALGQNLSSYSLLYGELTHECLSGTCDEKRLRPAFPNESAMVFSCPHCPEVQFRGTEIAFGAIASRTWNDGGLGCKETGVAADGYATRIVEQTATRLVASGVIYATLAASGRDCTSFEATVSASFFVTFQVE